MRTWRIFTPGLCKVVIEETKFHIMPQFDGMTEQEVIYTVVQNIRNEWPEAEIRESCHWDKPALEVSLDGNFYLEEAEEPPLLYYIAQGHKPDW